jgi:TadE-like protein
MVSTSRRGTAVKRINPRREDGVAMTEFALIVPIFLLIVAGLLGFGRVFFYWIEANHLASETARWAVVDQNGRPDSGKALQVYARDNATTEFRNNVNVCVDFFGETRSTVELGDPVRVKVRLPFNFVPILGLGQINIRGSSTMRIENMVAADPSYDPAQNVGTC